MLSSRFPRCGVSDSQTFAEQEAFDTREPHLCHQTPSENPYEPPSLPPHRNDYRFVLELAWYVARGAIVGTLIVFAVTSFVFPLLSWFGWIFGEFYLFYGEKRVLLTTANATLGVAIFGAVVGLSQWCSNRSSQRQSEIH